MPGWIYIQHIMPDDKVLFDQLGYEQKIEEQTDPVAPAITSRLVLSEII